MAYTPNASRYSSMQYRRCGNSGLLLPALSLGLWQHFGEADAMESCRQRVFTAFDAGITHFDLANNYGPAPGSAEENLGRILKHDFPGTLRDELIISTKAGYRMWEGPYGDGGSRKYLISSLDQSLKRLQLDYVDIFYHHRADPLTPMEETMQALKDIIRSGKALYIGLSNYKSEDAEKAFAILKDLGIRCLIHQPKYSMLVRNPEQGLLDLLGREGVGCIAFSSLAQGLLTNKYLRGIPSSSRAGKELGNGALQVKDISPDTINKINQLNTIAMQRGQSLAQMAIAWVLKDARVSSVIIGASESSQITELVACLSNPVFSTEDISKIANLLE